MHGNCMVTAWLLHGNCMVTAWICMVCSEIRKPSGARLWALSATPKQMRFNTVRIKNSLLDLLRSDRLFIAVIKSGMFDYIAEVDFVKKNYKAKFTFPNNV